MRDQAFACERRSHSSRPMRPRRTSPSGTSDFSSTPPPKYRASGSLTTSRGSPIAFSRHCPDSLRSRIRRCSSKGCASTEDLPKLRPRSAWALRDLAAGLPGGFRRALPTFGAWSSPRHWPLHSPLLSSRYHGRSSQAVDTAQDRGEQRPRHRHLGELENHVPPVPHDPGADLHEPLAQRRERPLGNRASGTAASCCQPGCGRCGGPWAAKEKGATRAPWKSFVERIGSIPSTGTGRARGASTAPRGSSRRCRGQKPPGGAPARSSSHSC